MDPGHLRTQLDRKRHAALRGRTLDVVERHVLNRTVVHFLREVAKGDNENIARKAREVLTEIATLWNDHDAGLESPL